MDALKYTLNNNDYPAEFIKYRCQPPRPVSREVIVTKVEINIQLTFPGDDVLYIKFYEVKYIFIHDDGNDYDRYD